MLTTNTNSPQEICWLHYGWPSSSVLGIELVNGWRTAGLTDKSSLPLNAGRAEKSSWRQLFPTLISFVLYIRLFFSALNQPLFNYTTLCLFYWGKLLKFRIITEMCMFILIMLLTFPMLGVSSSVSCKKILHYMCQCECMHACHIMCLEVRGQL